MLCRWVSDKYALASRVARLLALLDPECDYDPSKRRNYRGAHKSLARPGRKQATRTEGFDVHISYLLS
jgi:hypothetical protein